MKDTSSWLSIYCCSHAYRNCSLLDWVRFIYVSSLSSGSKLTFQYLHPEVHTIESLKQLRLIDNLYKIKESINFEYVHEWIIVYDGSKIITNPYLFKEDNKIKEYIYKCTGVSGNGQRNFALSKITNENTLLYYLDDDNIIHPNLYNLLNNINNNTIYSFNQYNRIKGGNPNIGYIDTAMVLIPFNLCKNIIWKLDIYEADGHYIKDCIDSNRDKHVYIDEDLCYYNFLK